MKSFFIRAISLILIVAALSGYNTILASREKEEEIARLNVELKNALQTVRGVNDKKEALEIYKDGIYRGEAEGFGGSISVEVIITDGKIKEISLLSAEKEDEVYLEMAKGIIPKMIERQSATIDAVSGATFSSTGIIHATEDALKEAEE